MKNKKRSKDRLFRDAAADPERFSVLYHQYAPRVYRYVFARLGNQQDAEDITAQVFEAALKGIERFDGGGNFSAWVFTIARNKIVDSYRQGGRVVSLEEGLSIPTEHMDLLKNIADKERYQQLMQVIRELPPNEQELLQLRFAGELSYAEIGEVVGKREGAVKMAVRRLLGRLQEMMEQENE